ncbi:MAG: site-2 protease family protein [Pseudomonadota bacterium]
MTAAVLSNAEIPAAPPDHALPAVREDIHLLSGPITHDGAPSWTLHDPVRNLFFRIGLMEFEILSRWHTGNIDRIIASINDETTLQIGNAEVMSLAQFLIQNNLVVLSGTSGLNVLLQQHAAKNKNHAGLLLQKYLFLRFPLAHPDRFLTATFPSVHFFFTRTFAISLFAALLLGLFLTLRQWDSFTHTFSYLNTPGGIAWLIFAMIIAKTAHELGHAYTAKRYGLLIPTMGLALLVFWPVLYTDSSEAWKLNDRKKRLAISAAGISAEFIIAVLALLLWSLFPDGPARSAIFVIATTSWVLTLLVNINPFVRFDGYYLLSDYLDIPNLQNRAFELARWKLHEWLFGMGIPAPGTVPARRHGLLITYAWLTWMYRFLLFTGIGLLVYHLFFKLAGIALLAAVFSWFIIRPVCLEIKSWNTLRERMHWNTHTALSLLLLSGSLLLLFVPWNTRISAPAIARYTSYTHIYPPHQARLAEVYIQAGEQVTRNQTLLLLESPELEHKHRQAERTIDMLNLQLSRQATQAGKIEESSVLNRELAKTLSEAEGYEKQLQQLEIKSPVSGTVVEITDALTPGRWVNESLQLALVVNPENLQVEAYFTEDKIGQIRPGASGLFYPETILYPPFPVHVDSIGHAAITALDNPFQSSIYGGDIASQEQADGTLLPNHSIYSVKLAPGKVVDTINQVQRGEVRIAGDPRSIIGRLWQSVAAVVIRESGF